MTTRSAILAPLVLLAGVASCSSSSNEDGDAPPAAGAGPAGSGGSFQQDNSGGTRPDGTGGHAEQQGGTESGGGGGASGSGNAAGDSGAAGTAGLGGIKDSGGSAGEGCIREYNLTSYSGSVEGLCPAAEVNHCDSVDRGFSLMTACAPDGTVCIQQASIDAWTEEPECGWVDCDWAPTPEEEEFCNSIIEKVENPAPLQPCVSDRYCPKPELCVLRIYNMMFCADPNAGSGGAGGKGAAGAAGVAGTGGEFAKAGAGGS
jgi:hypothetical protein